MPPIVRGVKPTSRQVLAALIGPAGIVPVAIVVAAVTDALIEANFTMILPPGKVSFLRGSDDYGCSNLFAAATALYVTFGVLASWYLSRRLPESRQAKTFAGDIARSIWILKFHVAAFAAGGYVFGESGGCDERYGSDFRNVFLLVCVVYAIALLSTVWAYRLGWSALIRDAVGPLAVAVWVVVGADGMTPKTWLVREGDGVAVETRSRRHEWMRRWYDQCERTLGSTRVAPPARSTSADSATLRGCWRSASLRSGQVFRWPRSWRVSAAKERSGS